MKKKLNNVLLIDDDYPTNCFNEMMIDDEGVAEKITAMQSAVEALDYLCRRGVYADRPKGNPAVLLLDLKMPKVDGLEVLRTVKTDPSLSAIPIVMLTSSREEQDLIKSYQLGVNAYVVKPVDFQAFMTAVSELGAFWAIINEAPPGSIPRGS